MSSDAASFEMPVAHRMHDPPLVAAARPHAADDRRHLDQTEAV
jgi:hypothetical protein